MLVESEGHQNTAFLHDDLAGAVGEAPVLVLETAKSLPGRINVGIVQKVNKEPLGLE